MAYGTVNADVIGTSVAGSNLGAGNASIMKNRIINGAMVIDQRNAGASVTPANNVNTYFVDRWKMYKDSGATLAVQQSSLAPTGFSKSLGVTVTTGSSPTSAQEQSLAQTIEGFNCADLGWGTADAKTVTLSFWVRSSLTGTFGGAVQNSGASADYVFNYTISAANTWEYKTITIVGSTSGTWGSTNGAGIGLVFDIGAGSAFQTTANAWTTGNFYRTSGSVQLAATTGATFYITGVQLEVGSSATGYEYRQYGQELALCQRYCYVIDSNGLVSGVASSGSRVWNNIAYPVRMRAAPTASISGVIQVSDNNTADYSATPTIASHQGTSVGCRINLDGFTGFTAGRFYAGYTTGTPSGQLFFSAEL